MGLFKKTKSRGPSSLPDEQIDIPTQSQKKSKKKWFSKKNKSNKRNEEYDDQVPLQAVDTIEKQQYPTQQLSNVIVSEERGDTPLLNQYNNTSDINNDNDYEDASIGDIPRSISTPSRDMGNELPPLPATPNDLAQCCGMNNIMNTTGYGVEEDSIGSPCDAMFKKNQQQKQQQQQQKQVVDKLRTLTIVPTDEANDEHNKIKNQATIDKLQSIITPEATPSIDHLTYYIQALSSYISPNPSGDLPARALRSLFTLSELSTNKQQRIDMVRGSPTDDEKELSLIPALLNFLQRCPRDSSEQYLTLLVLNNLSIPNENKRTIALQYDGVVTLGKLLCEDPGCHLLVIIIVNLTFGDESLNRDILETKGTGEDGEGSGVQLVESISYALLLATLTTEQLATLGPVPLSNEEGEPYSPSKLLSLLFTMLESKLQLKYHRSHLKGNHENDNLMLLPPISLGDNEEEYPFAETTRWCLGALKNLTRSSKLSPTSVTSSDENKLKVGVLTTKDTAASTVASQAILDSGILTLLLRIIKNKSYDDAGNWEANSAQDAALYTLLHMSSVPEIREVLRLDYECVEVLTGILNYGKAIVGEKTLVKDEEGESMGQLSLQCLKARLAMSYLVLGQENSSEKSKYGPSTTIAEHEAHSLIELLSHCLHSRAKEGTGGYSSATFSLKFVLYGIECILSEPANRKLFASTGNASRLNTLLLKAVSLTILNSDLMDSEAAENALQSIYQMTLYGLNEDELGYSITCGQAIFLPANLGDDGHDFEAKGVVTRVLRSYLSSQNDEISLKARNAANQIMFRLNYLRFDGSVADLTYTGKTYPAKSDYELDSKVFSVINMLHDIERKGEKPEEHIFTRSIVRKEKEGGESKVYSNVLAAAEELALSIAASKQQDDENSPISQEPLDIIAVANNITYYADGLDVYYGYTFKWGDGRGDLIERIYSAAETEDQEGFPVKVEGLAVAVEDQPEPQRKGCFGDVFNRMKLHSKVVDENEPYSIFGLRCAALRCGSGKGSASTVVLED